MARTKAVVLRLSEEEYNLLKELSGREPMNAYLRRVAGVEGVASESRPASRGSLAKDSVLDTDAPSPPEPQWKPAKPIPAEAFNTFKCPVVGCEFRAPSNTATCPQHGRRTSIMT